jgi:hypothetical protein
MRCSQSRTHDADGNEIAYCSPIRSPDCWKIVGKATAPHPLTGAQHMLTVIEGGKTDD